MTTELPLYSYSCLSPRIGWDPGVCGFNSGAVRLVVRHQAPFERFVPLNQPLTLSTFQAYPSESVFKIALSASRILATTKALRRQRAQTGDFLFHYRNPYLKFQGGCQFSPTAKLIHHYDGRRPRWDLPASNWNVLKRGGPFFFPSLTIVCR